MSNSEERNEYIWSRDSVKNFFRRIVSAQPEEEDKREIKEMIKVALKEQDIGPIIQEAVKEFQDETEGDEEKVRNAIEAYLQELGVPEDTVGHKYLCEMLEIIIIEHKYNRCQMKVLVKETAEKLELSSSTIMSSIYRIVYNTWMTGNKALLRDLFKKEKWDSPSPKEFLFTITDSLRKTLSPETC